jgi:hypothetical protein
MADPILAQIIILSLYEILNKDFSFFINKDALSIHILNMNQNFPYFKTKRESG